MAKEHLQHAVDTIRRQASAQEYADLADGELLKRFLTRRDHVAFEAIVRRYGPMILGVCRRAALSTSDAEDAFQAVFLVLLRKGAAIKQPDLLGNWLYGVAFKTARAARAAAQRRRVKEGQVTSRQSDPTSDESSELMALLDEELAKLPEMYRAALLICDLQEMSRKEAAVKLGVAEGTLSSRLARGRTLLGKRLARRGVHAPLTVLMAGIGEKLRTAELPQALIQATVQTVVTVASGPATVGLGASTNAIKLSETVVKMMFLSKIKLLSVLALALGMCFGVRALAVRGPASSTVSETASAPLLDEQVKVSDDVKLLLKQEIEAAAAIVDEESQLAILLRIGAVQVRLGELVEALATASKALAIAKTLDEDRHNVIVLGDVAMLQYRAGGKNLALETFQRAEKKALALDKPYEKRDGISDVLQRLCALEEYDEALRIAGELTDNQGFGLGRMAIIIPVMYRKDKSPSALQALQKARKMAESLGDNGDEALGDIAVALARVGHLEEAMQTVETIGKSAKDTQRGPAYKTNALRGIVRGQAASGDWQGALETYARLPPGKLRTDPLSEIAEAQIRAGKHDEAMKTIQELRRIADDSEPANGKQGKTRVPVSGKGAKAGQLRPSGFGLTDVRTHLLAKVAGMEAHMGKLEMALQTVATLPAGRDKAAALLEIGKAQCKAGNTEDGKKSFRRASRAAIPSPTFGDDGTFRERAGPGVLDAARFNVLQEIAVEQARVGDLEEAGVTLEDITFEDYKRLDQVLIATAEAGNLEGAKQMLAQIKKRKSKENALMGLTHLLTKTGDQGAALALAKQQTSPGMKAYALLGIIEAKIPGGVD